MTKRRYKTGNARDQLSLLPARIEDYVPANAPVRALDAYVDTLDLAELGFRYTDGGHAKGKGHPPYNPADLLKLYLYGYQNKVRSSRCLERETHRNLEVIWLLRALRPDHKTIANFRKDNAEALKSVNKDFVLLCRELNLYGGKKCAIDSSYFHGNASKASIYPHKRLDRELDKLEAEIERYQKELEENDKSPAQRGESGSEDPQLQEKLTRLKARQQEKQALKQALEQSGEAQISTTDKDARRLNKGTGTVAGYNVQIVVDDKHRLIVASDVTNDGNDQHQLHRMAEQAKEALEVDELEVLADASYHDAGELAACEQTGITAFVPEPAKSRRIKAQGRLTRHAFCYEMARDVYVCPQGRELVPRGRPFEQNGRLWTRYASRPEQCQGCPLRQQCLPEKTGVRTLLRSEYEEVSERHRARMKGASGKMRERCGMVEHPFGTLKCRAGWTHFLVRGFEKVSGEWALMVMCYNFSRVLNIIGLDGFMEYCRQRRKKRVKMGENGEICAVLIVFAHLAARIWPRNAGKYAFCGSLSP